MIGSMTRCPLLPSLFSLLPLLSACASAQSESTSLAIDSKLPGAYASAGSIVELSDGRWEDMPDPVDEVVNHRELPGEGEFPIREYVAALRDASYEGPWGVEVLSERLRNLPIAEIFDRAYATASAQLAR